MAELLPPVGGWADRAWQLVVLLTVSTVVLFLVDRLSRRLLPLVALLQLSMLFPHDAPSRLRMARHAIRRRPIEEQLARVREAGADPGAVAQEILTLVATLSRHDRPTRGHAERVRMFTDLIATQLRLPQRDRDLLRWVAILHDVGKLHVPAALLNKPGRPTAAEWELLRAHPAHGAELCAGLLPWLGEWADVIVQHHERYDGTGYPRGLAAGEISLGARIVAVADAYDVMTSPRAYRRPVSRAAALRELVRFAGTQFDPQVVRAMLSVGAPRLRRAQGVVAWLADLPLVAGSVPATTLARAVGAGALATTTATAGIGIPALAAASDRPPSAPAAVSQPRHETPGHTRSPAHLARPGDPKVGQRRGQAPSARATTVPRPARAARPPAPTAAPEPERDGRPGQTARPEASPRPEGTDRREVSPRPEGTDRRQDTDPPEPEEQPAAATRPAENEESEGSAEADS